MVLGTKCYTICESCYCVSSWSVPYKQLVNSINKQQYSINKQQYFINKDKPTCMSCFSCWDFNEKELKTKQVEIYRLLYEK